MNGFMPGVLEVKSGLVRSALAGVVLSVVAACLPVRSVAFDLDDVAAQAEQLAREPFQDPKGQVPEWLLKIDYDQWRDIRFRPQRALWRDEHLPFQVQFFHPGLYYDRTVAVNVIDAQGVRPVEFSTDQFDYGKNNFAKKVPRKLGYAGFRIHYPLNRPDYPDELIAFVGASYFRALARQQVYGLSARGIAIDTIASTTEEFPYFREFWLVRPAADDGECGASWDGRHEFCGEQRGAGQGRACLYEFRIDQHCRWRRDDGLSRVVARSGRYNGQILGQEKGTPIIARVV